MCGAGGEAVIPDPLAPPKRKANQMKEILYQTSKGLFFVSSAVLGSAVFVAIFFGPMVIGVMESSYLWLWLYAPHIICASYFLGRE